MGRKDEDIDGMGNMDEMSDIINKDDIDEIDEIDEIDNIDNAGGFQLNEALCKSYSYCFTVIAGYYFFRHLYKSYTP